MPPATSTAGLLTVINSYFLVVAGCELRSAKRDTDRHVFQKSMGRRY